MFKGVILSIYGITTLVYQNLRVVLISIYRTTSDILVE